MNERKLPGLPFDFPSGSRQGSTNGRPRPLLSLQWCDLHSRADGTEHASIRKPIHAELPQRADGFAFHIFSGRLGHGTFLGARAPFSLGSFFPKTGCAASIAHRR